MSMSHATLVGRLVRDPELRTISTKNGEVTLASLRVACDRAFSDKTDFFNVTVWRNEADRAGKYLSKGRLVAIDGSPEHNTYEKEGVSVETVEFRANRIQYLDSNPSQSSGSRTETKQENTPADPIDDDVDDDDMPF